MRLFLAAVHANQMGLGQTIYEKVAAHPSAFAHLQGVKNILESYHYFNSQKLIESVRMANKKVFLDSGAFSAYTKGVTIDLPTYCRFIQDNADIFEVASVLDAIGDPSKTYYNQKWMEHLGVPALPCFHLNEPFEYCDYYASNYEYITIGGMVGTSPRVLVRWLDYVWEKHLLDGAGRPKCKVHGFGLTSVPLMSRYPWYSVDSSSWVQISSMGAVLHPDHGTINLSANSPNKKTEGQHFDTYPPLVQRTLEKHFNDLGYTVEELRTDYVPRRTYCMWAYSELNRRIGAKPTFTNEQPGLF